MSRVQLLAFQVRVSFPVEFEMAGLVWRPWESAEEKEVEGKSYAILNICLGVCKEWKIL